MKSWIIISLCVIAGATALWVGAYALSLYADSWAGYPTFLTMMAIILGAGFIAIDAYDRKGRS